MPTFVQDPVTRKLIPKEEYHRTLEARERSAYVQEDIKSFKSPIDGSIINTRSDLRDHNLKHGVTDQRDYGSNWFERKAKEREADMKGTSKREKAARIEAIQESMYKHGI